MKHIKKWEQLFESVGLGPSVYNSDEFKEFFLDAHSWAVGNRKGIGWDFMEKRYWDMYIKSGYTVTLMETNKPIRKNSKPPHLIAVVKKSDGSHVAGFDENNYTMTEKGISQSIDDHDLEIRKGKSKKSTDDIKEFLSDMLVSFTDKGYEMESDWQIRQFGDVSGIRVILSRIFTGRNVDDLKFLISESDLSEYLEEILESFWDEGYEISQIDYVVVNGVKGPRICHYFKKESNDDFRIFKQSNSHTLIKDPIGGNWTSHEVVPLTTKGPIDLIDFLKERGGRIINIGIVFKM